MTDKKNEGKEAENNEADEKKKKKDAIEIGADWGNELWKMAADTFNSLVKSDNDTPNSTPENVKTADSHASQAHYKTAMQELREADKKLDTAIEIEEGYQNKGPQ